MKDKQNIASLNRSLSLAATTDSLLKYGKRFFGGLSLIALTLVGLTACHDDEQRTLTPDSPTGDSNKVIINLQINTDGKDIQSRSTPFGTKEEQSRFNVGDQVVVEAGTQSGVTYTLQSDGNWTSPEGKYLVWQEETMGFRAYYPADAQDISITGFKVPTDQSSLEALAKADYMTYRNIKTNDGSNVATLEMERKMARIVINEVNFGQQLANSSVEAVTVHGNTYCFEHGNAKTGDITVSAYKHTDGKFYALVSPTLADENATFITLTVKKSDGTQQELAVTGIPETVNGNSYSYDLTVGEDMTLSVSNVKVTDWVSEVVPDGTASEDIAKKSVSVSFINTEKLQHLAYGEKVDLKQYIKLEPEDADLTDIKWSDESGLTSVDANCILTVKYAAKTSELKMTGHTITLVASDKKGNTIGSTTLATDGGHILYNFADGLSPFVMKWTDGTTYKQESKYIHFDLSTSKRQDITLASTDKAGGYYLSTAKYKYFAVKMRRPYYYDAANGYQACQPGTSESWRYNKLAMNLTPSTGDNIGHQNIYKELDMDGTPSLVDVKWNGQPKVYVLELNNQKLLDATDSTTGLVEMNYFDIVVADVTDVVSNRTYDLYWMGTFESLEAIKEYYQNNK